VILIFVCFYFVCVRQMASPAYEPGHPPEKGVEQARLVERALRESRAIDLESLCVLAGEKVWQVRLDAHVLDNEGNVQDCLSLACVSALAHFRRPDVTVVGEHVTVHSVEDRQPVPLALHHLPISCSFAFFDPLVVPGAAVSASAAAAAAASTAQSSSFASAAAASSSALMVVDPSLKEEQCADSGLVVTLNVHGEICTLQKSGGMGLQLETLLAATRVAGVKVADWTNIIQTRLKEEAAKANTGNAVRGGTVPTVYHTSAALAARPIDALGGSIVTKAPGQHATAGVPIEIRVGGANPTVFNNTGGVGDADEGSSDEDEDGEDKEEEDEDMAAEDDEEEEAKQHKQQAAEMAQAAQKLQAKHQQQQQQQQQQPKAAKQHAKK
jgi:exosome complex component RRP45